MAEHYLPERTVLIVEDEIDIRDILRDLVTDMGYKSILASNATEGLEIVKSKEIHAVLADVMMPKFSGLDFLKAVRALGYQTPVSFITGMNNDETLLTALRLGAFDFIRKPFDVEQVKQVVERSLEAGVRIMRIQKVLESAIKGQASSKEMAAVSQLRVRKA